MGLIRYLRRRLHIDNLKITCESTHQIASQCLEKICSNGGGIQTKLDQTIQIQKSLKETGEALLMKAEENTECRQKLNALEQIAQAKIDQALQSQQQLRELGDAVSSKADQAIARQQELINKTDQVLSGQQDLGNKTDQVLSAQQDLTKKADQSAAVHQELVKKADQVLAGQAQLNETVTAAQSRLDQVSASQNQCVNETEFSRMSRTLFAGFRYWEENFYNAIKGTDIEERYDRLVSGLSDKDVTIVESMIGRIQHLFENGDTSCYLPDESERIYRNQKNYSRVVRLNDHCFVCRNFKLPINVFETSTFACNYGLDLIDHPEYADGKDIIDAGAYIGDSALVFGRFFSKCRRIYAFEPDAKSYGLMEKTIAMNNLANVIPVGLALGDSNTEGVLTSHDMGANLVNRQFGQETEKDRTVMVVRLDDYVTQNNIVPGVIKTDLEGFEMHFLRGALDTIKKYRPILVLSIYHSADDFFGIKPFIEDLDLGYRFKLFKADDGMILGGTCLICVPGQ